MKAWYSRVRDTELIDGSTRADYVVVFETDNIELKREVEKYLQGIMDRNEFKMPTMDKCHKCKHWNYSYGCQNKKGICQFEAMADRKTEPQTDTDWKDQMWKEAVENEPQTERSE